jgi:hypothetical protein
MAQTVFAFNRRQLFQKCNTCVLAVFCLQAAGAHGNPSAERGNFF